MKMMLAVIAMAIASPAIAQTAPPADAHAGHSAPAGKAAPAPQTNPAGGHAAGHEGHDMTDDCCEKAKAKGKKMPCCEKTPAETPAADPHAGHDMSQH